MVVFLVKCIFYCSQSPTLVDVKTHDDTTCSCKFAIMQDPTLEGEQSDYETVVLPMSPL